MNKSGFTKLDPTLVDQLGPTRLFWVSLALCRRWETKLSKANKENARLFLWSCLSILEYIKGIIGSIVFEEPISYTPKYFSQGFYCLHLISIYISPSIKPPFISMFGSYHLGTCSILISRLGNPSYCQGCHRLLFTAFTEPKAISMENWPHSTNFRWSTASHNISKHCQR